jgi:hypothetical protein
MKRFTGILLILTSMALTACASTTRLSTHRDATIYLQATGEPIGTGNATYQDSKPVWADTTFRVEANGCDTKLFTIHRSDDIQAGRVIGGFFVLFPWLWAGDYNQSYGIPLDCESDFNERMKAKY